MKVLLDTNIILDVWFKREPFLTHSLEVMSMAERSKFQGYLCATSVTTLHYLGLRSLEKKASAEVLNKLLLIYGVASVNKPILQNATLSPMSDYEDAVIDEACSSADIDLIVTRNTKDFIGGKVIALQPEEFLDLLQSN